MSSVGGLGTAEGTRGLPLWICSVVMPIVAGMFVAVRIIHRAIKKNLGWDDYIIVASLILSVFISVGEIKAVEHGYGARFKTLTRDQVITARKWFYMAQIVYKIQVALNKISICQMYYRIFAVSSKSFRVNCCILQAVIISSSIAFTFGTVGQCTPIAAFWDTSLLKTVPGAWCFTSKPWWMSFSITQVLLDFALLALPIKEVVKLNMSKLEKVGLILVFCTGLFATFTSIYRATTLASSASDPDPMWGPIPALIWAVIEANSGIIAACLPLLRQPFIAVFGRAFGSRHGTDGHQYSQRSTLRGASSNLGSHVGKNTIQIGRNSRGSADSERQMVGKDIHVLQDISVVRSDLSDRSENTVVGY